MWRRYELQINIFVRCVIYLSATTRKTWKSEKMIIQLENLEKPVVTFNRNPGKMINLENLGRPQVLDFCFLPNPLNSLNRLEKELLLWKYKFVLQMKFGSHFEIMKKYLKLCWKGLEKSWNFVNPEKCLLQFSLSLHFFLFWKSTVVGK